MSMETIERLVTAHNKRLESLAVFRKGDNELSYNFNESTKATQAIAQLIVKATGNGGTVASAEISGVPF